MRVLIQLTSSIILISHMVRYENPKKLFIYWRSRWIDWKWWSESHGIKNQHPFLWTSSNKKYYNASESKRFTNYWMIGKMIILSGKNLCFRKTVSLSQKPSFLILMTKWMMWLHVSVWKYLLMSWTLSVPEHFLLKMPYDWYPSYIWPIHLNYTLNKSEAKFLLDHGFVLELI